MLKRLKLSVSYTNGVVTGDSTRISIDTVNGIVLSAVNTIKIKTRTDKRQGATTMMIEQLFIYLYSLFSNFSVFAATATVFKLTLRTEEKKTGLV